MNGDLLEDLSGWAMHPCPSQTHGGKDSPQVFALWSFHGGRGVDSMTSLNDLIEMADELEASIHSLRRIINGLRDQWLLGPGDDALMQRLGEALMEARGRHVGFCEEIDKIKNGSTELS